MRRLTALIVLLSAISSSIAEELKAKDVPAACMTICNPVILLSNACDVDLDETSLRVSQTGKSPRRYQNRRIKRDDSPEDRAERFCMCRNTSFDVAGVTGLCASCLAQNGNDDAVEDISEIMADCAFSSTTYAPSATAAAMGLTIVAMIPVPAKETASASIPGGQQVGTGGVSASGASSWNKGLARTSFLFVQVFGVTLAMVL